MTDRHSKEIRSYNMSKVRGKDTKPELLVRRYLHAHGFRYRIHVKDLPGKPDIVLPKYKAVIFINGCFWHGHEECKYSDLPKTRTEWWRDKINKNIENDIITNSNLSYLKWNVFIIWTCELKVKNREETLRMIVKKISEIETA